jgi:hypothetical protein
VDDDTRKQFMVGLREFLRDKWRSPSAGGQIVRINEVGEMGRDCGLDEREAWRQFKETEGLLWEGQYLPESRSEERGYTAVRLSLVR